MKRNVSCIVALGLHCVLQNSPSALHAQTPSAPAGSVLEGRVADPDGRPVSRVRVEVVNAAAGGTRAAEFTNAQGRFAIETPQSSSWALRVTKAGFAGQSIDPLERSANRQGDGAGVLDVELIPGAVLTGQVMDERGAPVVGAGIRARFVSPPQAARPAQSEWATDTDDRGVFRIGSLPEGEVEVVLSAPQPAGAGFDRSAGFEAEPVRAVVRRGDETHVTVSVTSAQTTGAAAPQVSPRGTAAIQGRIAGPDSQPVSGALVRAVPAGGGVPVLAYSDAAGHYALRALPAGRFRLHVSRSGFVSTEYGQVRALQQGTEVTVRDGQTLDRVDVMMPRGSVVTGRIVNAGGEPMEGVFLQVWHRRYVAGRTVLAASAGVRVRQSDDRGVYRLHGLLPGTYFIVASREAPNAGAGVAGGDGMRIFYPGRQNPAEALPLRVDVGEDVSGLDFPFDPAPGVRVGGTALDASGQPVSGVALLMTSFRSGAPVLPPQTARLGAGGGFEFGNVAPGEYVVQVLGAGKPGPFAAQYLTVADVEPPPVAIRAGRGSRVTGRISLEGDATGVSARDFSFMLMPADFDRSPAVGEFMPRPIVDQEGRFSVEGVTGVFRFVPTRMPDGWWLRSVEIGGREAAYEGVEFGTQDASREDVDVVFSGSSATVEGRAEAATNSPASEFSVIVFAADPLRWFDRSPFVKLGRSNQDGRFAVTGIPPGEYLVVAVDIIEGTDGFGDWRNPDVLNTLTGSARRITLGAGTRESIELRLVRMPQ